MKTPSKISPTFSFCSWFSRTSSTALRIWNNIFYRRQCIWARAIASIIKYRKFLPNCHTVIQAKIHCQELINVYKCSLHLLAFWFIMYIKEVDRLGDQYILTSQMKEKKANFKKCQFIWSSVEPNVVKFFHISSLIWLFR